MLSTDPRYASVSSQQATYCNDAAVYDTTTTSAISKAVSSVYSASVTASTTSAGTESAGAVAVATITSSTASATSTAKSGAEKVVPGLMGFAGLVAALF